MADEFRIDIVQHVGPDFSDIVNFVESLDAAVFQRVDRGAGRVWVGADTSSVIVDPNSENKVGDGGILVLEPFSKGIAPAFAHSTGFGGLEATSSTSSGHAVGGSVGLFMSNDLESNVRGVYNG